MKGAVRFWGGGFRKAECGLCHALLRKNAMRLHARWHVRRGESMRVHPGDDIWSGHNDVRVYEDHETVSGWVSSNPGPM